MGAGSAVNLSLIKGFFPKIKVFSLLKSYLPTQPSFCEYMEPVIGSPLVRCIHKQSRRIIKKFRFMVLVFCNVTSYSSYDLRNYIFKDVALPSYVKVLFVPSGITMMKVRWLSIPLKLPSRLAMVSVRFLSFHAKGMML